MAIDPYALCPCGSGKKIKFCECGIDTHELERISKLIEGEQFVATFDRINTLLKKTPNAAWLLAIKGEMALRLGEAEVFQQTAERFVQLKPTNPLALAMQALSVLISGSAPLREAANYLLSSLAESAGTVPNMAAEALAMLVRAVEQSGNEIMLAPWDGLGFALLGSEWISNSARSKVGLNLMLKSASPKGQVPADAPWRDRYQEAQVLTQGFRHAQAESKLKALLRDFPGELTPLMLLFDVQRTLLDDDGLIATAGKLRDHEGLDAEHRAYYEAMILAAQNEKRMRVADWLAGYELPAPDEAIARFAQEASFSAVPEQALEFRQMIAQLMEEEVPPSHVYLLYDRPVHATSEQSEGEAESDGDVASDMGMILLYGKQVDKPARLYISVHKFRDYPQRVRRVLDDIALGAELTDIGSLDRFSKPVLEFLNRRRLVTGTGNPELVPPERLAPLLADEFPDVPLEEFGQRTIGELVQDPQHQWTVRALLMLLEGAQFIQVPPESIQQTFQSVGLERPAADQVPDPRELDGPKILALDRIAPDPLDDEQLTRLIHLALAFSAIRSARRAAEVVRSRESTWKDPSARYLAATVLSSEGSSTEERLQMLEILEELAPQVQDSPGKWVVQRFMLLAQSGRSHEAQDVMVKAMQKYPSDPHINRLVGELMAAQRGAAAAQPNLSGGGQEIAGGGPAEQAPGKLVIPGQEDEGEQQSGSGLWLPGQ
ncbi:MAG: hypothetical protein D6753_03360 [Planctomycetota bacterium]|nr:MAG: hypothetical protein D6753_03360 [Planctomycetota bacterium]